VEVDEAKFGMHKFHCGRRVDGIWALGMVERDSNSSKCVIVSVDSRDEKTLVAIIKQFILPGATIISDCWKSYINLAGHGHIHLTVNHYMNSKDPETGAHTNTIEGLWNQLRRSKPKFGTTRELYSSYFTESMYRRRYFADIDRSERFYLFINHIVALEIW
jgi:hypothetical protein